jgi:ketosteroid isomerase-like protein
MTGADWEERAVELATGGVAALQEIARLPRWPDGTPETAQLALLRAEAQLRDEFMVYAYAYDNSDLDTVTGFFADDCVMVNPRGPVRGVQAIREKYRAQFSAGTMTRHIWSNIIVRFLDAVPSEAYVTAYHHTMMLSGERAVCATGTDIRRLRETGGIWKITQRCVTIDVEYPVAPDSALTGAMGSGPEAQP